MKKIKIVNLTLAVITLLSIILTPKEFYVGHVKFTDYLILGVIILTSIMVLADKSKGIVQTMALTILILIIVYITTTAYFYFDADLLYKSYRLIYLKVALSDDAIKTFEYLNFFSLVLTLIVVFALIFVFLKIYLKYRQTLAYLSK